MSQLGLGVMIGRLFGGREQVDQAKYTGRQITDIEVYDERVKIKFADGTGLNLTDDGQSCCEHRYITCDDDVKSLVGSNFVNIDVVGEEEEDGTYDVHEKAFVKLQTDKGFVTFVTHNEHNGYYGGFLLTLSEETLSEENIASLA